MNVSKFFRRYSRVLLMVFMSLLLVVFLIGPQLQDWSQKRLQQEGQLGRAFGEGVSTADVRSAEAKQQLLAQLGFGVVNWLEPLDAYLLIEEARRMGVRVGHDQVKEQLARQLGGVEQAEKHLASLQRRYGRSYASIFTVGGEWLAVLQLMEVQGDALGGSVPRAELVYRNQTQAADVQFSVVDSEALVAFVPEPSEEELQAFFEEAKDRSTGHTEDELVFGYQLPDRVRLEYLTIDPREIESKVRVRPHEVKAYYESHKEDYVRTVRPPPVVEGVAPQQPQKVPLTFEEAAGQAREDARADKATREAQNLINKIRRAAHQPWRLSARDEDGYRAAPPADAVEPFEALRDKFSERFEVTYKQTDLLGLEELSELFGPGALPSQVRRSVGMEPEYREGQSRITLSELALRVRGLFAAEADDRMPVLNVLEPSPVMIKPTDHLGRQRPGQAYVFRVAEVVPKGPPDSLDEVRAEAVADYRLLKAHELAGEYARQLVESGRQVGLTAAVEAAAELKERLAAADEASQPALPPAPGTFGSTSTKYAESLVPVVPQSPLVRAATWIREIGEAQKVPREVFALAEDPGLSAASPKLAAVEVANLLKWVVVELREVKPVYAGEFAQRRTELLRRARGAEQQALVLGWLGNVRKRADFAEAGVPDSPDEAQQ